MRTIISVLPSSGTRLFAGSFRHDAICVVPSYREGENAAKSDGNLVTGRSRILFSLVDRRILPALLTRE